MSRLARRVLSSIEREHKLDGGRTKLRRIFAIGWEREEKLRMSENVSDFNEREESRELSARTYITFSDKLENWAIREWEREQLKSIIYRYTQEKSHQSLKHVHRFAEKVLNNHRHRPSKKKSECYRKIEWELERSVSLSSHIFSLLIRCSLNEVAWEPDDDDVPTKFSHFRAFHLFFTTPHSLHDDGVLHNQQQFSSLFNCGIRLCEWAAKPYIVRRRWGERHNRFHSQTRVERLQTHPRVSLNNRRFDTNKYCVFCKIFKKNRKDEEIRRIVTVWQIKLCEG